MNRNRILLFLPFVIAILLAGLWTSLQRLGWILPGWQGSVLQHGQLMILGFLGSLISLERAVALQVKWTFSSPILFAVGTILSIFPITQGLGYVILILASFIFFLVMVYLTNKQTINFNIVMTLGNLLLLMGNIFWFMGKPIAEIIFYWIGFLVLTILGERLELTRMLPIKPRQKMVGHLLLALSFIAIISTSYFPQIGAKLFGLIIIALSVWFLLHDIARRTIRNEGQTKFTAIGLILGYFWLIVSGIFLITNGNPYAGLIYDAYTHTIFLGFVFSMIFVHAPIIFPAVFGQPFSFSKRFYSHLFLLQITLVGRVAADFMGDVEWRLWFGLLNVLTILLFFGNTLISVIMAKRNS